MKITFVIPSLSSGGAERVLILLAQAFINKAYQVTVVTLSRTNNDFYTLPVGSDRLALGILGNSANPVSAIVNNLARLSKLRKAICSTKPDVVISFVTETNILTIISLLQTGIPVIATEHCDPNLMSYGKIWEKLRRFSYPYATKIVSVSQGVDNGFDWLSINKRSIIYNPFLKIENNDNQVDLPIGADSEKKWILSMGRLTYQKGFDILLSAFAQVANRYPNWQLIILGKGEQRQELEKLVTDLSLSHQVIFPGVIKNPFPILKKAEVFVMASRFEGFPMSHGEAMACGCPIIATDCPSGPREIIRHDIDGILVPTEDVSALAKAMDSLMSNEKERIRLASRATEVTERFSLENVMDSWDKLFEEITHQNESKLLNSTI
ncbi:glycosyltransferase family 4 protein [Plectonema cf. radiosum LEGE 06105]|uniref:Glycosyltransferase family 4 protein n=1 Tax=Plectonema cf. radiosum LEGE 06105 TaxID=945769 RepID=A0A8J7F5Z3_9CYAN|nr:glycosyltransferase family 4 protein [Plectonema radiosum]MBE9214535.1 glycosyltransferase family 4 protein [Plectonema cf. radiosum LEGE 06105]